MKLIDQIRFLKKLYIYVFSLEEQLCILRLAQEIDKFVKCYYTIKLI